MKSYTPYKKSVKRYITQSIDKLFGTTEFAKATRNVLRKKTTGVSEFSGKGSGLIKGDTVTILEVKASDIRGIYLVSAIEAVGGTGFKTVEFGVSPPSTNNPVTPHGNGLLKSYTGGTSAAQYKVSYDEPTDTIRLYLENEIVANVNDVYDYTYKITVFYK